MTVSRNRAGGKALMALSIDSRLANRAHPRSCSAGWMRAYRIGVEMAWTAAYLIG